MFEKRSINDGAFNTFLSKLRSRIIEEIKPYCIRYYVDKTFRVFSLPKHLYRFSTHGLCRFIYIPEHLQSESEMKNFVSYLLSVWNIDSSTPYRLGFIVTGPETTTQDWHVDHSDTIVVPLQDTSKLNGMTEYLNPDGKVYVPDIYLGESFIQSNSMMHRGVPNPSSDWRVLLHVDFSENLPSNDVDLYLQKHPRKLPRMSSPFLFDKLRSVLQNTGFDS